MSESFYKISMCLMTLKLLHGFDYHEHGVIWKGRINEILKNTGSFTIINFFQALEAYHYHRIPEVGQRLPEVGQGHRKWVKTDVVPHKGGSREVSGQKVGQRSPRSNVRSVRKWVNVKCSKVTRKWFKVQRKWFKGDRMFGSKVTGICQ